ncbi:MAG: YhbY family RNA-binding protein [Pseudomonadales bacterium]|nr:YhbY family RNA-binding protein [Pseudomonadales bacterium]
MQLTQAQKKQFRTIGHSLKPVVTIADKGLSESVFAELQRALDDHELIKVRISTGRDELKVLLEKITADCNCECIQRIGKIALLFRAAKEPKKHLSNIPR